MNEKLTNEQLQEAISSLLAHFNAREHWWKRTWCGTHAPDGATKSVLANLLYEQSRRAITNVLTDNNVKTT